MTTKTFTLLNLLDRQTGIADPKKFDISITDYDDVNINNFPKKSLHALKFDNGTWNLEEIFNDEDLINYTTDVNLNEVITDLIGFAPSTLDTLGELSTKINSDYTIIDDLTYKLNNNKQWILKGDGESKIFHLPNHRAGYTSLNLNGVEKINRINDSRSINDQNYFLYDQYDYYSGYDIVAYQAVEEFSIFGNGTDLYKYENSIGYSFFGPGEIWGMKRNSLGRQVVLGEIFSYGKDYIWSSGTNLNNDNYFYSSPNLENVDLDFTLTLPNDSQEYFYYKLNKITAPNPLDSGETSNKIYMKTAPPDDSYIFIRMYF